MKKTDYLHDICL